MDADAVRFLDFVLDSHLFQPRDAVVFIVAVPTTRFIISRRVPVLFCLTTPANQSKRLINYTLLPLKQPSTELLYLNMFS